MRLYTENLPILGNNVGLTIDSKVERCIQGALDRYDAPGRVAEYFGVIDMYPLVDREFSALHEAYGGFLNDFKRSFGLERLTKRNVQPDSMGTLLVSILYGENHLKVMRNGKMTIARRRPGIVEEIGARCGMLRQYEELAIYVLAAGLEEEEERSLETAPPLLRELIACHAINSENWAASVRKYSAGRKDRRRGGKTTRVIKRKGVPTQ